MSGNTASQSWFKNKDGQLMQQSQETYFQTGRLGLGYHQQSKASELTSLDDKVADADTKLKNFLAEIESLEAEPNSENDQGLPKTKMPGFVSAGHVIYSDSASENNETETITSEKQDHVVKEPQTPWQHILDEGTQYYYYWNIETNEVTWTIPEDYTEYLLKLKLYNEALAAGKKPEKDSPSNAQAEIDALEKTVHAAEAIEQDSPLCETNGEVVQLQPSQDVDFDTDQATGCREEKAAEGISTTTSLVSGLVVYDSDDNEADEEDTKVNASPERGKIKSLVAYDESYNAADDNEDETETLRYQQNRSTLCATSNEAAYPYTYDNQSYLAEGLDEAPLIFTGPPPPPPPPPPDEQKGSSEGGNGLSSIEISEFSSVIEDKLCFLDVTSDSISKLQMLLIQLKTRLDDWQSGGLSKEYLIEKMEETDGLLETCESEAAPAGWKCHWSRKEKQYYFVHEITEEISWSYPDDDLDAALKLVSRHKETPTKPAHKRSGTLAQLTRALEIKTADSSLKALFSSKLLQKCTKLNETTSVKMEKTVVQLDPPNMCEKGLSQSEVVDNTKFTEQSSRRHNNTDNGDRLRPNTISSATKPKAYAEDYSPKKKKHKRDPENTQAEHHSKRTRHSSEASEKKNKKYKKKKSKSKKSKKKKEKEKHEDLGYMSSPTFVHKTKDIALSSSTGILDELTESPVTTENEKCSISPPDTKTNQSPIPQGITTPENHLSEGEITSESIDDFLLTIERETQIVQNLTTPKDNSIDLHMQAKTLFHPPPPPPPPPPPQPEENVMSVTVQPAVNLVSKIVAPVLYSTSTNLQSAADKVVSHQTGTETKATITKTESLSKHSEIGSTNSSKTSAETDNLSNKQKDKTKKSKKASAKMPVALVQKWQKVQTEITEEMIKERRLKEKLKEGF